MRGNCTICTDYFGNEQDVSATLCGHVFHEKCLSQWFMESKPRRTCPQCRTKLKADQVIPKLFINLQECTDEESDPYKLREDLTECRLSERTLISEKKILETALKNMKKTHKEVKDVNKTLRVDLKEWKQRHDGLIDSMKILQSMAEDAKDAKKKISSLQERLKTCSNIELILDAGKAEVTEMLKRYSRPCEIKELAAWCSSLKQEYEVIKLSRDSSEHNLMKMKKLCNQQRKDTAAKASEIEELKEVLDLHKRTEVQLIEENSGLRKKVDALQMAISSPSETRSSAISRLIKESPAPTFEESLHLTPDIVKVKSKRPANSSHPLSSKVLKLTQPELELPRVKIIDTTRSIIHNVDTFTQPAFLPSAQLSRTHRNHPKKLNIKTKPFSAKPVMSASLRPTLNLMKPR